MNTNCPICTRPAAAPFRSYDSRGHVTSGCVDAFHTGRLVTPSESASWHNRPAAKTIRRENARRLRELLG